MRKHKSDFLIIIITFVLLIIGTIVIYAIGPMRANFMNAAYGTNYEENFFFLHQLFSVAVAVAGFIVAYKFPYTKLRKLPKILMIVSLLSCILLAIFAATGSSLASCENGACRWIKLGSSVSFQPAEFLKLSLILYFAQLMAERKSEGELETKNFFIPFAIVSALSLFMVVYLQQDLGSTVVLAVILLALLIVGGVSTKKILIVVGIMASLGVLSIAISPHRMERLLTFTSAEGSDSYHIDNALLAIGTGGWTGVGIGNTVQASGYLPESINDSVFAVMGETFGFIGLLFILTCFAVLLSRVLIVAERGGDLEGRLIAAGVFAWVAVQVVVNICAMTGIIPLTGITLPLLSYGGTSLAFVSVGLGLVAQMSCYTKRSIDEEKIEKEHRRVR